MNIKGLGLSKYQDHNGWRERLKDNYKEIIVITSVVLHVLIAFLNSGTRYITQDGVSTNPALNDFCNLFSEQLSNKMIHPKLMPDDLYRKLSASNYKVMELSGKERVFRVYSNEDYCGVVLKDELGLRTFEASYSASNTNPFYYLITGISEKYTTEGK